VLQANSTLKTILSMLRTVGNFLNGTPDVRGFQIDYLAKVRTVSAQRRTFVICPNVNNKRLWIIITALSFNQA
jgi:hypothetical protein